ncbi:MAG TPA: serine hydrolase, partial [Bacteriovoracaceae bacterium]|nr:serine hydrolase [Bacteriovoracaceae bacterium]
QSMAFDELDGLIFKAIENKTLPGGVLIIGQKEKVLYQKNYESSFETIYDLASLTKITTAMSLLILEEEMKLRVSDKLSKYYPEFNSENKKYITIENLLRHNSGLAPVVKAEPGESYEDFIAKTLSLPLDYKTGEKTVYSDVGFIILGDLIQKVSGLKLSDFTKKKIFSPLGMKNTGYHVSEINKTLCAPTGEDKKCVPHDPKAFYMFPHSLGHAGVFSTIHDLSYLAQLFINKGILNGKRILKEVSVRKMSKVSHEEIRGMGFDLLSPYANPPRGEVFPKGISYGHTGFTGTTFWVDPETESYYIFLSNRVYLGESITGKPFTELRRKMATFIGDKIYKDFKR